jgi:hypothetical protein
LSNQYYIHAEKVVTYAEISSAGVQSARQQMAMGGNFVRHSMRSIRGDGVWTTKFFFVKKISGGCLNDGVESKRAHAVGSWCRQEARSTVEWNPDGPSAEKKIVEDASAW